MCAIDSVASNYYVGKLDNCNVKLARVVELKK
jgi:hypothetical protein